MSRIADVTSSFSFPDYQNIFSALTQYSDKFQDTYKWFLESMKVPDLYTKYQNLIDTSWLDSLSSIANIASSIAVEAPTEENEEKIHSLSHEIADLRKKEKLKYIFYRISEEARVKILEDASFRAQFEDNKTSKAVVLSMDVRRSTELMLKSREPSLFSEFINLLINRISKIVQENYGIFDKFTGDGALAFFPEFYSGKDALYLCIKTAIECHDCFQKTYAESKHCFSVVLREIGLGIGIDYGDVSLNIINSEYTVVGVPVVYACRMSNTDAFKTLLNQPAFEVLEKKYSDCFHVEETEIEIKHEGNAITYSITAQTSKKEFEKPEWSTNA